MQIIFFLTIFGENNGQIASPIIPRSSNVLRQQLTRSRSSSTSSSTRSLTERHQHIEITNEPVASTSKKNKNSSNGNRLQKVDLSLDETRRLRVDLNEAAQGTHAELLNPARDGYYTRLNRVLLRYGASVGLGTAIGAGALDLYERTHAAAKTITTTTTTEASDFKKYDSEENNLLG